MDVIDKDRPTPQWIEQLRRRYPTEREIDRILTRRLTRRAGAGYSALQLETLIEGVGALIASQHNAPFEIIHARWLSGGASKLHMAFTLDWDRPGVGRELTRMVLRMEPAESMVETSRLREFQLLRAVQTTVPVPPVFWCDTQGDYLPYPALVYGFSEGVTKPKISTSGVSGVGTRFPDDVRRHLAPQFVEHLAGIHDLDFGGADLSAFDVPQAGTQCALWAVNHWERVWEEDHDEDSPMIRLAAAWLRRRLPTLDQPRIVHGDFRVGNFLFNETDNCITAWLDWESSCIGDPHQDLAYVTTAIFGSHTADGIFLVNGLMSEEEFLSDYERVSGRQVDRKTLHWYKVYSAFFVCILILSTAYRVAHNGKSHQDILLTWSIGAGHMLMDDMCRLMAQGD